MEINQTINNKTMEKSEKYRKTQAHTTCIGTEVIIQFFLIMDKNAHLLHR